MSAPTIEQLIALAEMSKAEPDFPAAERGLYDLIIVELRRIEAAPHEDFSPALSRSLVDGSWETPFFRPFNQWLGEHRRGRG